MPTTTPSLRTPPGSISTAATVMINTATASCQASGPVASATLPGYPTMSAFQNGVAARTEAVIPSKARARMITAVVPAASAPASCGPRRAGAGRYRTPSATSRMTRAVLTMPRPGRATAASRTVAATTDRTNSPAPMSAASQRRRISPPTVPARISAAAPDSAALTVCASASATVAHTTDVTTAMPCSTQAASSRYPVPFGRLRSTIAISRSCRPTAASTPAQATTPCSTDAASSGMTGCSSSMVANRGARRWVSLRYQAATPAVPRKIRPANVVRGIPVCPNQADRIANPSSSTYVSPTEAMVSAVLTSARRATGIAPARMAPASTVNTTTRPPAASARSRYAVPVMTNISAPSQSSTFCMDRLETSGPCGCTGSSGTGGPPLPLPGSWLSGIALPGLTATGGAGRGAGITGRAPPKPTGGGDFTRNRRLPAAAASCSVAWISSERVAMAPWIRLSRTARESTMSRLRNCILVITLLSSAISCSTLRPHSGHPVTVSARAPQFEQGYVPTAASCRGCPPKACLVGSAPG